MVNTTTHFQKDSNKEDYVNFKTQLKINNSLYPSPLLPDQTPFL